MISVYIIIVYQLKNYTLSSHTPGKNVYLPGRPNYVPVGNYESSPIGMGCVQQ